MPYRLFFALCLFPICAIASEKADRVVVYKSTKTLTLYQGVKPLGSFAVAFGANPKGHKQHEGDERTPEGRYLLDYKKADTQYHRSIHISYPNQGDIAAAKQRGVPPGGDIMIHGQRNGYGWAAALTQRFNWTNGCIALRDEDMDKVWESVETGTPIEIYP